MMLDILLNTKYQSLLMSWNVLEEASTHKSAKTHAGRLAVLLLLAASSVVNVLAVADVYAGN